jgi:OHCU decarboxylase
VDPAQLSVTSLASVSSLNAMSLADFATALKPLLETAGPLADALYAGRPFGSYDELLDEADHIITSLPRAQQIEVLSAHPRIGEAAAAVQQTSEQSYREQGYAAEADLQPDEVQRVYARLSELNRAYEDRFGFRFVVFVNGRSKAVIADVLEQRLNRTPEEELSTGLHDMIEIARDRLRKLS